MTLLRGLIASLESQPVAALARWTPEPLTPIANTPVIAHSVETLARAGVTIIDIAAPAGLVAMLVDEAARHRPSGVEFRETILDPDHPERSLQDSVLGAPESTCVLLESTAVGSDDLSPHLSSVHERLSDAIILECPDPSFLGAIATEGRSSWGDVDSPEGAGLAIGFVLGPAALRHLGSAPRAATIGAGLDRFAAHRGNVSRVLLTGWCKITGSARALLAGNRLKLDELVGNAAAESHPGCHIEGRVRIHRSAEVRSSRLRGPLVIGAGAHVADSYIGPYTSIGAGCRIEGSEVENSILLPGVRIHHFGHRIEDSVIGENAKLRREFRVPSGLSFVVGPASEVTVSA